MTISKIAVGGFIIAHAGSADYLSLAGHFVEDFRSEVDEHADEITRQYAITTYPSYSLVMHGSDICYHIFPERFSLLFQFKFESPRSSVTLFEIENQLTVTVDTCDARLYLNFGGSCQYKNISLSLKEDLEAGVWHKIGISFTPGHLSLFVNCKLAEWKEISECPIRCNEDSVISILLPNTHTECGSSGKVLISIHRVHMIIQYLKGEGGHLSLHF